MLLDEIREGIDIARLRTFNRPLRLHPCCTGDPDATMPMKCSHHRLPLLVQGLWVARVTEERARDRLPREALGTQVEHAALTSWFKDGVDLLVHVLEVTESAMPVWSLTDDRSVGFWQRRMAHETAIHRWDAQGAHGLPEPIHPWLAHSGLTESLILHVSAGDREPTGGLGGRLRLHCLDERGDWVIVLLPHGVRVEPGVPSAAVEATVVGTACDLWLLLTGRSFGAKLQVYGDAAALERFEDALQTVAVPQLR